MSSPSERNLGFCVKDLDLTVLEQNSICEKICGFQKGKKCNQGCILKYEYEAQNPVSNLGIQFLRHLKFPNGTKNIDGMVINDGENIITYIFDTSFALIAKMQFLGGFNLTSSELNICKMALEGQSNSEIAKALFISEATLRTHLNNIYKKIPVGFSIRT